ncbi:MAG: NAD-dependent DNA ligase LigA [Candidatus Gygaella obscura]|nr:NAD-dependent DNA ligase LigA [Candidatus Gygaella obscura]
MVKDYKKAIEKLKKIIRHHDYLYYVLSSPEISDKEYDDLIKKLKYLEKRSPQYRTEDSPSARVGSDIVKGFRTVRHKTKMLSLENAYSFEELYDWDKRIKKILEKDENLEYVTELKIDGVSANLTYKKSSLVIASTRGNGDMGEDVTVNIKTIRSIPLVLLGNNYPDLIEIRGEVYMNRVGFNALNRQRKSEGIDLFANLRNAASGSLKLLDTKVTADRKLKFFAHSLGEINGLGIFSQKEFMNNLKSWGVPVNPHVKLCKTLQEVVKYCEYWQGHKDGLDYDIDGVVVKINSLRQQKILGATLKSPRWAIAYKFPAQQATTDILDITFGVGRTGIITPVAKLKPVECAGVVIKHATLHNFDEIKRLNIKIGDKVLIERAGDVIPKIIKVVKSKKGKSILPPKKCPTCSGKVVKEKDEDVAWRCINPVCSQQIEAKLLHFTSKQAMDIEGMGDAVIAQLVKLGLVKDFADIYELKNKDLEKLDLFKDKKINNLLLAIEKSKKRSLSHFVYGLGIRHVGEKAAFVLSSHFVTLEKIMKAKKSDLQSIHEIGSVMAESIIDYFSQVKATRIISQLKLLDLQFLKEDSVINQGPLKAKIVVFTGELKNFTRPEAQNLVRRHGGNFSSSVSSKTDFVIVGENPGSKLDKAKRLGVVIIYESEFKEMLK